MQIYVLLLSSAIALTAATAVKPPVEPVKIGDCNPSPGQKCRCRADDGHLAGDCNNGGDCPTRNTGHYLVRYTCYPASIEKRLVDGRSPQPGNPSEMPIARDDLEDFQVPQLELPWTCRPGDQCQCVNKDRIPYGESCTEDNSCRKHLEDHKWCVSPPFMTGRSIPIEDHPPESTQKEVINRNAQQGFRKVPRLPRTCMKKHQPCYCVDRTGEIHGHLNRCSKDSDCERDLPPTRCDSPPFFARRSAQDEYEHKPTQKEAAGRPIDASNPPAATVAEENKKVDVGLMRELGTWPSTNDLQVGSAR